MAKPDVFSPKTQEALGQTLQATRNAMAEVHENMRILEEARERAEKRIESLERELGEAKQALADATATGKILHEELENAAAERSQISSKLAAATAELDQFREKLDDVSNERDAFRQKAEHFERVLHEKMELETSLAKAAEVAVAQEAAIDDLKRQLKEARDAEKAADEALSAAEGRVAEQDKQLAEVRRGQDAQQTEQDRLLAERDEALVKAQEELGRTRETVEHLSADCASLKKQLQTSEKRVSDLTAQMEQINDKRKNLENELTSVRTRADKQVLEQDAHINRLEADIASLCGEKERQAEDLANAREEIEGLNAQLASELELRKALEVNLDVARRAISELKAALPQTREEAVS